MTEALANRLSSRRCHHQVVSRYMALLVREPGHVFRALRAEALGPMPSTLRSGWPELEMLLSRTEDNGCKGR
jgi:hypothetical protein